MTREEAIKKLSDQLNTWEAYDPDNGDLREAIEMAIEALQQPGRPKGKWVPYEFGDFHWRKCTNCNRPTQYKDDVHRKDGRVQTITTLQYYCRLCGAEMEKP